MPLTAPNEGLTSQLDYILSATISGVAAWQLVLFSNNPTLSQTTVYADLTLATFTGYSAVTLARASWVPAYIDSGVAKSTWTTTPVLWTCTGGAQTIYGYAIVTASSPKIIYVEKFASPVAVAAGGVLGVLPEVTLGTAP